MANYNHKCPCAACGTNIAFPEDYLNQQVTCPSCGVQTLLTLPAVAPPAAQAVAVRAVASNAATTPQAGGPGFASLHGGISIFVLVVSGLLLAFHHLALVPISSMREYVSTHLFIVNLTVALGWGGIVLTFGNCALLVQVRGWKKAVMLLAVGFTAVGHIAWSADSISSNVSNKPMMLPSFTGYALYFFLDPASVLAVALALCGWPRWTVIGLEVTAVFASAVATGILTGLQKKALTTSPALHWVMWLAASGAAVLSVAAAAVSLFAVFRKPAQATPAPATPTSSATPATVSTAQPSRHQPTSRVLYVVLGLFFGCLGVHNFLAGYTRKGVVQLLITLCTCFIGAVFVAIWALIEVFTVKADADGVPFT